ncbi:MAG: DUF423 domain-containing protein [Burkholderiaceae bacterium]|nr:DUF423 domain-containing protein [Burkholderiaceae bacterium]
MDRWFLLLGGLFGAVGVAASALAAHALKARLPAEALTWVETAARMQLVHALALLAVAALLPRWPGTLASAAGWCFVAGTVLFCGSLYVLAAGGARGFAHAAPLGGLAFVAGWLLLAAAAARG